MKRALFPFLLTFLLIFTSTGLLQADEVRDATQRIRERLSMIDNMRVQGLAGENNEGYLTSRGSLSPEQQTALKGENEDREIIYKAVARETGLSPSAVGRQRAQQIAKRAARGIWLQDPDGSWYQK